MNFIERFRPLVKKKSFKISAGVLVVILLAIPFMDFGKGSDVVEIQNKAVVDTISASAYVGNQSISLIGNVRAFSQANITSERSGRVVNVNATLGQQVKAGTILASLENSAESASVLQAEGVYDAAVAAGRQSVITVDEATNALNNSKNNAVSTFRTAYSTTNGIVLNSLDTFFSNPNSQLVGLRIDGRSYTSDLTSTRVKFQTTLPEWQSRVNGISTESNLDQELDYARTNIQSVIDVVNTFINIFSQQDSNSRYTEDELKAYVNTFTGLKNTLIGVQSSLDSAKTAISSSEDTLKRAQLSTTGGEASASDAQIKQALGALRAAQANYAKTIIRTPISGTVNSISMRPGDYINALTEVAVVANNDALEVVTYISDDEKELIEIGDTVVIEGEFEGIVTNIAPAVDSLTRKTEVRIATEGIDVSNGDTVRITKEATLESSSLDTVKIPLTAVRFDRENGSIFTVQDGKLVSNPVVIGNILGSSVEILEGLTPDQEFVGDARGLIAGEEVEITN